MAKSNPKTFRLNNLTGGINSISEDNAIASFDFANVGVAAEAKDIENFAPLYRGGQSKAKGFTTFYNTGSASKITGLYRYINSSGSNLFLYGQGTKVYKLAAGVATDIGATVANNAYLHFETATDKVVICDGVNAPVYYNGTTVSTFTDTPPTAARQSLFYQNRLWMFSATTDTSLVYYSDPNDITVGYPFNFVQCDTNDGQKIVGISRYFIPGRLEPLILVEKERSIGVIFGDGTDANPYSFVKVNQDIGGVSFRTAVQYGSDIAYLTPRGVTSYKVDNAIVNLFYNYLSEKVRNRFQELNQSALYTSMAWYDWKNTRISFAVPEASHTTPNVIWHFDTRLSCWYKERWSVGQDCTASFIDTNGVWYHGDSNGKIYVHDGSDSFDGKPINAFYITGYMDFGDPNLYKNIRQARIMLRGNGNYGFGIGAKLNYGARLCKPTTIQLSAGSYKWGEGTWNSSGSYKWGKTPIKFPRYFPGGDFQNIQLSFSQSGSNQPVDLFELEFIVEITGLQ